MSWLAKIEHQYAVVGFLDAGESVGIAHISWLRKKNSDIVCYWPRNNQNNRARKNEVPDKDKWTIHRVRVFVYTKTYEEALKKSIKAQDTSNIDTGNEDTQDTQDGKQESMRAKKPRKYESSESEEEYINMKEKRRTASLPVAPTFTSSPLVNRQSSTYIASPVPPVSPIAPITSGSASGRREATPGRPVTPIQSLSSPIQSLSFPVSGRKDEDQLFDAGLPTISVGKERRTASLENTMNALARSMAELAMNQREMMKMMKQIVANTGKGHINDQVVEDIVETPISSEEDFDELMIKMANEEYRNKMIAFLSALSCHKPGDSVRKMLRKIGTNKIWSLYSLKGKKKKSFSELPLYRVIIKANLRANKNVRIVELDEAIQETLKHAPNQKDGPKHKKPANQISFLSRL